MYWLFLQLKQRNNSTTTTSSSNKLTSSYYYHASSLPFIYKTVSQSFDEIAAKYQDHECFYFKNEGKRYTFKSFQDEIDSLAAVLIELGFEKNDRLAVWLPNTSENVVVAFAASKIGLIKVNINPAYVERELEYCINKVECKGIVLSPSIKSIESLSILRRLVPELDQYSTSRELFSKNLPTLKHIILTGKPLSISGFHSYNDLIEHGKKISHHSKLHERQISVNPDSPAAIFYTSGTTGQPKAATVTHFSLINMAQAQWEHCGPYFTCICVPIPLFHMLGEVGGKLNTALAKCKVVFPAILPDPVATMQAIHDEKCTALIGAPIIFRDILSHPDRKKYDLTSLKLGVIAASPMYYGFLRQLEKEIPIERIAQTYGLTESSGLITSGLWAGDGDSKRRLGSIGRCMQRIEIKIADRDGNTVPIGQQGEICARYYPVMAGYYGDPDKTQETITPSGWLRTGDQATMDEDGYLYFVGRQKEMIIRGGVNIYPVEIEKVIVEHPSVAEAQVFSIPDERHDEEVCAWIKLKPNAPSCQVEDIKKFLSDKLAFFKIPKHIRIVDQFITTTTGKVQKFKLSQIMICFGLAAPREHSDKEQHKDGGDHFASTGNVKRLASRICANSNSTQSFLTQARAHVAQLNSNPSFAQVRQNKTQEMAYIESDDKAALLSSNCTQYFNGLAVARNADKKMQRQQQKDQTTGAPLFQKIVSSLFGSKDRSSDDD
ncbi:unnamed protein product [Rotaria sordida]|uniref:Medium-chain acyl-CoA ligase ACSF2, mitochondrial n=1 Tax=Rotaria sordida TaxID=392033 RepID=A0A818XIV7_9BILA|nr:unnamed protein product [Rotaria sordida]